MKISKSTESELSFLQELPSPLFKLLLTYLKPREKLKLRILCKKIHTDLNGFFLNPIQGLPTPNYEASETQDFTKNECRNPKNSFDTLPRVLVVKLISHLPKRDKVSFIQGISSIWRQLRNNQPRVLLQHPLDSQEYLNAPNYIVMCQINTQANRSFFKRNQVHKYLA